MTQPRSTVIIAVTSLAAEGTPRMTLTLCREWLRYGLRPIVVVLHATPADLASEFDALRVERITLDLPKRGYRRYLVLAAKLYSITRRYRAKAFLSMPLGWHTFMAVGSRLGGARRVVAHVGNYPNIATGRAFSKFRMLVRAGQPLTHRLVCCSDYVRRGAIEHFGISEMETAIVYNGVDHENFEAVSPGTDRAHTQPVVIGMVARLEKHKDHATLIRAAAILRDRQLNIIVELVGEGSQRQTLEDLIDSRGLRGRVRLLGMRQDIPAVLAGFDLFVFSTTPDEGLGIALVEAMLAGLPIIASDVGACREVLDDGDLGSLVPAADAEALAEAIEDFMASPHEAEARAQKAKAKARETFSAHGMARAYADILDLPLIRVEEPALQALDSQELLA